MPMIPFVKNGYYGSRSWIPLVNGNGLTAGGGEPEPPIEWKTVTGESPLAIANAISHSIRSLTQYGKCVQSSTPTPSDPVDIYCNNGALKYGQYGTNLCNPAFYTGDGWYVGTNNTVSNAASNGTLVFPCKPNTTYSWWHTSGAGGARAFELTTDEVTAGQSATWAVGNPAFNDAMTVRKYTTSADAKLLCVLFARVADQVGRTIGEQLADFMLVEGDITTATPYEPYKFGFHTVGTPEVLTVGGKNLNGGTIENKGYTSTGGESTSTTFAGTLWKIPCKEGDKFTVSWGGFPDGVSGVFINTWLTDGTWNARQAISAGTSLTYTVGAGVGIINFTLYKTGGITIGDNAWLQVEYGSTATEYEPYVEPQTASVVNLYAVGDYADEGEIINGIKTGKVGVKVFDGTETIGTSNACFTIAISDRVTSKTALLCSHFPYSTKTSTQTEDVTVISFSSTNIGFRYDACATKADFAAWLAAQYAAGTPVIVLYPLAEETTEQVTGQALHTTAGDNVVSVTSNVDPVTLEVEYATTPAP